jgi:hypothetical protein
MERYKFPPMLGPARGQPAGSYQRAECFGNELDYTVERVADAVDHLADLIKRILADDPPPWDAFPNPPCELPGDFFEICCGINGVELGKLLHVFGHHDLCVHDDDP